MNMAVSMHRCVHGLESEGYKSAALVGLVYCYMLCPISN